jgi:pyridine nucleotide-disulfide oxidoreductase
VVCPRTSGEQRRDPGECGRHHRKDRGPQGRSHDDVAAKLTMASAGLVVIGSGPAGVSAAEAFRQHNPQVPVRIVTEDAAAPYSRPPLSKEYLRGDDSDINLHPADWFDNHAIALMSNSTVCDIDISGKTVLDTDGVRYEYEWLVLTCGAGPTPLPVPGGGSGLLLRSLADAASLRAAPDTPRPRLSSAPGSSAVKRRHPLHCRGFRRSRSHRSQYRRPRGWVPTSVTASLTCWRTRACPPIPGESR